MNTTTILSPEITEALKDRNPYDLLRLMPDAPSDVRGLLMELTNYSGMRAYSEPCWDDWRKLDKMLGYVRS